MHPNASATVAQQHSDPWQKLCDLATVETKHSENKLQQRVMLYAVAKVKERGLRTKLSL